MGCIESVVIKQLSMFSLSHKTLSNETMKPSRLFSTSFYKSSKLMRTSSLNIFRKCIKKFQNRTRIIASCKKQHASNEDMDKLPHHNSQLIAKSGKIYL